MIAELSPVTLTRQAGVPGQISLRVENVRDTISGFCLRVLGADPDWAQIDVPEFELFPGESRDLTVRVQLPEAFPAGVHRLTLQLRELGGGRECWMKPVEIHVPARESLLLTVKPPLVSGGRTARFRLRAENTGNTTVSSPLLGVDEEAKLGFRFSPARLDLAPGQQGRVEVTVSRRRAWTGMPTPRMFSVFADVRSEDERRSHVPVEGPVAQGAFLQKPWINRVALSLAASLAVLALVLGVAAVTIGVIFQKNDVDQANTSTQLDKVSDPVERGAGDGTQDCPCSLHGTVVGDQTTKAKLPAKRAADAVGTKTSVKDRAGVEAFRPGDLNAPVDTAPVEADGTWKLEVPAGEYLIRLVGAGPNPTWYPQATDPADAVPVTATGGVGTALNPMKKDLALGKIVVILDIDNPAGAQVQVTLAPGTTGAGAVVATAVPVPGSPYFLAEDIPAPADYLVTASKDGYRGAPRQIHLNVGRPGTVNLPLAPDPDSGLRGPAGPTGSPGPDGRNGVDGTDGTDGVDGTDGHDGANGSNGAHGVDGTNGTNGTDGTNGLNGTNGVDGINGRDGRDGTDGADGSVGPPGPSGPSGPAGPPGPGGSGCTWWYDLFVCVRPQASTTTTAPPTMGPTTTPATTTAPTTGGGTS